MNSLWLQMRHCGSVYFQILRVCVCAVDAPQMKKSKLTLKCEIHYLCECISVSMATTLGIAEQRRIRWGRKMRMDFQQGELIMMITRKLTYIVSPKLEKPFPIIANLLHQAGPLRETAGFKQIWGLDQGNFWCFQERSSPCKQGKPVIPGER